MHYKSGKTAEAQTTRQRSRLHQWFQQSCPADTQMLHRDLPEQYSLTFQRHAQGHLCFQFKITNNQHRLMSQKRMWLNSIDLFWHLFDNMFNNITHCCNVMKCFCIIFPNLFGSAINREYRSILHADITNRLFRLWPLDVQHNDTRWQAEKTSHESLTISKHQLSNLQSVSKLQAAFTWVGTFGWTDGTSSDHKSCIEFLSVALMHNNEQEPNGTRSGFCGCGHVKPLVLSR